MKFIYLIIIYLGVGCGPNINSENSNGFYDQNENLTCTHEVIKSVIKIDSLDITQPEFITDYLIEYAPGQKLIQFPYFHLVHNLYMPLTSIE